MAADSKTIKLGKTETPKQASKRYDAVQKKLRDEFYLREIERERKPRPK